MSIGDIIHVLSDALIDVRNSGDREGVGGAAK